MSRLSVCVGGGGGGGGGWGEVEPLLILSEGKKIITYVIMYRLFLYFL